MRDAAALLSLTRWKIIAYSLAIDLREVERKQQEHGPFRFASLDEFEKAAADDA